MIYNVGHVVLYLNKKKEQNEKLTMKPAIPHENQQREESSNNKNRTLLLIKLTTLTQTCRSSLGVLLRRSIILEHQIAFQFISVG